MTIRSSTADDVVLLVCITCGAIAGFSLTGGAAVGTAIGAAIGTGIVALHDRGRRAPGAPHRASPA
jgi:hypothetical protein